MFCFGPRLGLKTELLAQAEQFFILRFFLGGGDLMRKERKIGEKIEAIDFFNVHNIFTYYFKTTGWEVIGVMVLVEANCSVYFWLLEGPS